MDFLINYGFSGRILVFRSFDSGKIILRKNTKKCAMENALKEKKQ